MATRTESNVVNAAGLVQGIVLVTFPAASTIFTDPDDVRIHGKDERVTVKSFFQAQEFHRRLMGALAGSVPPT